MRTLILSIGLALGAYAGVSQFLLSEGELIGKIAALHKQEQQAQVLAEKLPELKSKLNEAVVKATAELRDKKMAAAAVDKILQAKLAVYEKRQQEEMAVAVATQSTEQLVQEIEGSVQAAVNQKAEWEEWQLPPFVTEAERSLLKKHWFKK